MEGALHLEKPLSEHFTPAETLSAESLQPFASIFEVTVHDLENLVTDTRQVTQELIGTGEYYDCLFEAENLLDSRQALYQGEIVTLQHKVPGPGGALYFRISFSGGGAVSHIDVPETEITRISRPTSFIEA